MKLKHSERRAIKSYFESEPGYILDFTNRTFAEFFDDEMSVNIYNDRFAADGESKARRLFCYLDQSSARDAAKLLRALWQYKTLGDREALNARITLGGDYIMDDIEAIDLQQRVQGLDDDEFELLVQKIEKHSDSTVSTDLSLAATRFDFDTVVREIDRAREFIEADPEDAITAACSLLEAMCRSILVELDIDLPKEKSLKHLFRAVRDPLGLNPATIDLPEHVSSDVRSILSGIAGMIDGIAALRTHAGDAHGRERGVKRVDARISRLAINSASSVALFIIESWERKFPRKELPNHTKKQRT